MGIADAGFGTIYKGAQGTIAGNTLMWLPGYEGDLPGNTFTDWNDLYAARQGIPGRVTIEISDFFDDPIIEAGEYDLSDTIVTGIIGVDTGSQIYLEFSDGAVLLGLPEFHYLDIYLYNEDPLIYLENEESYLNLYRTDITDEEGGGFAELVDAYLEVRMFNSSNISDDDGSLFFVDSDSLLIIDCFENSHIDDWCVEGDGFMFGNYDASSYVSDAQDIDQANYPFDYLQALAFNFNSGIWDGDPSDPDDALYRMAGALATAISGPIP